MTKVLPFHSVVIFGGAGFIGSNWASRLLKTTGARVHIFDNLSRRGVEHNVTWLRRVAGDSDRLEITVGDVRDATMVHRAVQPATEVYNFAAQVAVTTSIDDPREDFEINVGGTLNILEAARKSWRKPFLLFTSTNKVYGHLGSRNLTITPTRYRCADQRGVSESQPLDFYSPYGCSKGAADQYVHDYSRIFGMPTVVFRMSCIAGPRQFGTEDQGWVAHFLYSALQDQPVTIYGDGRQVRDVLYVEDLLRAFESVRDRVQTTGGQVYNVGGGLENSTSLLEIISEIERVTGKKLQYTMDLPRSGDQPFYVTDFSKLHRHTRWQPRVSVPYILEHMSAWWKANRDLLSSFAPARVPISALQPASEVAS
jgi:CDP-paratose 2-epimerase